MPAPQRIDDPLREAPQRIEEFWRRDPYGFARVEAFAISRWVGRVTDDDLSDVYVGVAEIVDLGLSANEATKKIRSVLSSAVARRRRHEQRSVLGEIAASHQPDLAAGIVDRVALAQLCPDGVGIVEPCDLVHVPAAAHAGYHAPPSYHDRGVRCEPCDSRAARCA